MFGLTERETKILEFMTKGLSNSEIGEELFISRHTVKSHISAIIKKMGSRDRTQAAFFAGKLNLF